MKYSSENYPEINYHNSSAISAYFSKKKYYQKRLAFWYNIKALLEILLIGYIFDITNTPISNLRRELNNLESAAREQFKKYHVDSELARPWIKFRDSLLKLNESNSGIQSISNFDYEDITQEHLKVYALLSLDIVKLVTGNYENYGIIYISPHCLNSCFITRVNMTMHEDTILTRKQPKEDAEYNYNVITEVYCVKVYKLRIMSELPPIYIEAHKRDCLDGIMDSFNQYKSAYIELSSSRLADNNTTNNNQPS